jgi:hypothetical protein
MRRAEPIAGIGGVLLLVALFLPWYALDVNFAADGATLIQRHILVTGDPPEFTGWQALSVTDILLALLAVPAILVPVISVATSGPAKSIGIAVIASATGWIAIVLVVFRLLDPPGGSLDLRYGAWLALAGAILAWVGSWLSMRDESTPGAVAPDVPRRPVPNA